MPWTEVRGLETIHHEGSNISANLVILNPDGKQIEIPVNDLFGLLNNRLSTLEKEMNAILEENGVSNGFFCKGQAGLISSSEIVKNLTAQVFVRNQYIVHNLISMQRKKSRQEYEQLVQLATKLSVKTEMDTNDWNKLALEVSRKELGHETDTSELNQMKSTHGGGEGIDDG